MQGAPQTIFCSTFFIIKGTFEAKKSEMDELEIFF
jgi:hypothetical protein